ncbi:uncharacterized protein LOC143842730 [Paroedura picta]|uniref:uncharacterized protein LOC143842730 n=1 Tax=Paroedura picta TaxID=143630 RepID=UPI00405642C2
MRKISGFSEGSKEERGKEAHCWNRTLAFVSFITPFLRRVSGGSHLSYPHNDPVRRTTEVVVTSSGWRKQSWSRAEQSEQFCETGQPALSLIEAALKIRLPSAGGGIENMASEKDPNCQALVSARVTSLLCFTTVALIIRAKSASLEMGHLERSAAAPQEDMWVSYEISRCLGKVM